MVVIVGEKEAENELVSLKDLHSQQDLVKRDKEGSLLMLLKGEMSMVKLLEYLKSKDQPVCEEEKIMKEKAFYGKEVFISEKNETLI